MDAPTRMVFRSRSTGETLLDVGGAGPPRVVEVTDPQAELVRAVAEWLRARAAGQTSPLVIVADGDRCDGKEIVGASLLWGIALARPGAAACTVSPEPRETTSWSGTGRQPGERLPNGSTVAHFSGPAARSLPRGPVDAVLIHEAQSVGRWAATRAVACLRGGGIGIMLASPAMKKSGRWLADVRGAIRAGTIAGRVIDLRPDGEHFAPEERPRIAAAALAVERAGAAGIL